MSYKAPVSNSSTLWKLQISRTLVVGVTVIIIAATAMVSKFQGQIHLKIGWDGGQLLIDSRNQMPTISDLSNRANP
jgi:hypothetical protein